jgi:hypothetical protein
VITLDLEPSFEADLTMDIREFAKDPYKHVREQPDVILASPPCEAFSVMTIGRNWTLDHEPKTEKAALAIELVRATMLTIGRLRPLYWVMENPRAKLRRLMPDGIDRVTVTYCQYGEPYMKPTDLWGGFPPSWSPRPMCRPKSPCHASAARGSRTGIQGEGVRWTHPVLVAQSNNGFREGPDGERARTQAFEEEMHKRIEKMGPPTKRTKFQGGMISDMSRFPSWSKERKALSALRAMIPRQLSEELCIAAERDITNLWTHASTGQTSGAKPPVTTSRKPMTKTAACSVDAACIAPRVMSPD